LTHTLYVANTDAVMAFPYRDGVLGIDAPGTKLAELPAGTLNHHWTKSLIASPDGRTLYVGVGSNSNVAENGIEQEKDRAAILAIDRVSGATRVFASGLRNPVGMAWEPERDALWVAVNERDELGSDLVPDYMTSVKEGAFYGLAVQLLRPACGHAREAVACRSRREGESHRTMRLARTPRRSGLAYSPGGTAGRYGRGMFVGQHGFVESATAQRVQSDLRSVCQRSAVGNARRRADRVPR
jgi:glucose/arabinose dehydrogenase